MQLIYDPRQNIAYLRFHEKTAEVETICVSDELNVDIAPDGTVYGVELLNANKQLRDGDTGTLVVINEALGNRQEVPLAK
jgi:uncharacterized protein YuzE